VQRRFAARVIERPPQDLAIDGDDTLNLLGKPGHEAPKRGAELVCVKATE
jgi:hypothetical protein